MKKSKTVTTAARPQRWFLDCDEDGHTYLIPANKRAEWEQWMNLPWSNTKGETLPAFVRHPTCDNFAYITFTDPVEDQ